MNDAIPGSGNTYDPWHHIVIIPRSSSKFFFSSVEITKFVRVNYVQFVLCCFIRIFCNFSPSTNLPHSPIFVLVSRFILILLRLVLKTRQDLSLYKKINVIFKILRGRDFTKFYASSARPCTVNGVHLLITVAQYHPLAPSSLNGQQFSPPNVHILSH